MAAITRKKNKREKDTEVAVDDKSKPLAETNINIKKTKIRKKKETAVTADAGCSRCQVQASGRYP